MKIGIFGGSFDPCTSAHYEIVRKVLVDKLVDKVVVMPTIVSYYRKDKDTLFSREDRRTILEAWFNGLNDVFVDCSEYVLASSGANVESRRYIDMLDSVMAKAGEICKLPDGCELEFFTIIGNDSYLNFKTWHRWQDIIEKSKLIVVNRGSSAISGFSDIPCVPCFLSEKFQSTSASAIRKRLLEETSGMSMGPGATPLNLYLEEVSEYLHSGKTFEECEAETKAVHSILEAKLEERRIARLNEKLNDIGKVLVDPYKDADTKYSIIEDIMKGTM